MASAEWDPGYLNQTLLKSDWPTPNRVETYRKNFGY